MTTLALVEERLRPLQGVVEGDLCPRYLFRGQDKDHKSITPLIARRPSPAAISQLYKLFLDASVFASGIGGHRVSRRDGIGLLQHYGLPTPFIDFSGCLDVAIFFALLNTPPDQEAIIYVLDRTLLTESILCFELEFMCLPFGEGGERHRHLRQDAFVAGPADWSSATAHVGFDLLASTNGKAIAAHPFIRKAGDYANIADILSLDGDPIPRHLVDLVHLWAEQRLAEPLHRDIEQCLQEMLVYRGAPPNPAAPADRKATLSGR